MTKNMKMLFSMNDEGFKSRIQKQLFEIQNI